jgi:hypothetical protein
MGRKGRKKISRRRDEVEQSSDNEEPSSEWIVMMKEQAEVERLDAVWNLHKDLLKYREDMAVPLCEYLSIEVLHDFIDGTN